MQLTVATIQLPANTHLSPDIQTAIFAAVRQTGSMAAGIETMAVRALEQGEIHLLDDIANLSSLLTEQLRNLSVTINNLKPHG